ncbi:hypothetical protein FGO68_gene10744 [Halteria grandinella]|uniref:E3 ubiquitin-protein ligase RNF170 n=1 Tax=Halteria grandinella TaxID=5974 RepID=A0A8J8NJ52_HALGN|nr:hypothetical protein FGO68_gene10744 [Halteria grandinella]
MFKLNVYAIYNINMEWLLFLGTIIVIYLLIFLSCMSLLFGTFYNQITWILSWVPCIGCCTRRRNDQNWENQHQEGDVNRPFSGNENITDCPICIAPLGDDKIAAMCGHQYCAKCFLQYWQSKMETANIECPCCRRRITFLTIYDQRKHSAATLEDLQKFNRYSTASDRTFVEQIRDMPFLIELMANEIRASGGGFLLNNFKILAVIIAVCIYGVSPIDIIPDFVPILGFVDDIFAFGYCAFSVAGIFFNILRERNNQEARVR